MAVTIKSEHEIELMREAGRILAIVHDELAKIVKPGISTLDIDRKCEEIIRSYDCIPSFLNYQGFPASVCTSINEQVVHGIPGDIVLKDGDIVSVKADNERGTIFNQVKIRVDDSFTLEMHIDTDEANAAKIATGNTVTIIK